MQQRCWSFADTEFVYFHITFPSSFYSREDGVEPLQPVLHKAAPGLENLVPSQCRDACLARPELGLEVLRSVQTWHR